MDSTQKIYYYNKPLVLTTDAEAFKNEEGITDDYLLLNGSAKENFLSAFEHLKKDRTSGAIIVAPTLTELTDQMHEFYKPVDAGGGVVTNSKGEVLLIYRRGIWDLPKGKLDDGESIEDCAVREVEEETGVEGLILEEKLCNTYHVYSMNKRNLLKRTAWYKMKTDSVAPLNPQAEESIAEAVWVAPEDLEPKVKDTYEAIRVVLNKADIHW